jgi:hypothetical protein
MAKSSWDVGRGIEINYKNPKNDMVGLWRNYRRTAILVTGSGCRWSACIPDLGVDTMTSPTPEDAFADAMLFLDRFHSRTH